MRIPDWSKFNLVNFQCVFNGHVFWEVEPENGLKKLHRNEMSDGFECGSLKHACKRVYTELCLSFTVFKSNQNRLYLYSTFPIKT